MWLRHLTTPQQRRNYRDSAERVARAWPDEGSRTFETIAEHNRMLISWAKQRFGRQMSLKAARFLYGASDYLTDAQLDRVVHGGLLDINKGKLMPIPTWRWLASIVALIYFPLAAFGALSFSILVIATDLPAIAIVVSIAFLWIAFLGHALHAKLVLIDPILISKQLRENNLEKRLEAGA